MNWFAKFLQTLKREVSDPLVTFNPPGVTPDPAATRSLELTWQRRRIELAGWQPTNGWLMDEQQS